MRRPTSGRKRSTKRKVGAVKRKTTRRRSRRGIGATGDVMGLVYKGAGIGTGIIAARVANNLIQKVATLSPILSGVIQAGAGYALGKMNKKGGFVDDIADGVMGNGIAVVVISLAAGSPLASVINGPNDGRLSYFVPGMAGPGTRLGIATSQARQINGAQLPAVAGAQLPVVSGHASRRGYKRTTMVG